MSKFAPRLGFPESLKVDSKWVNTAYGGTNRCIARDTSTGSVIPNCTGYAWGRATELIGHPSNLSAGDGGEWYGHTSDGYHRNKYVPSLGAIACFESTTGGAGHVAVVEVKRDGSHIVTSNSAYSGPDFWTEELTFDTDANTWMRPVAGYAFQGFIYLPIYVTEPLPIWMYFKLKEGGKI